MGTATTSRRSTTALSAGELTTLRGMLEQQRGFRREQLAALTGPQASGPLGSAHDEVTASLLAGARTALADVEAALRRMREGGYGRCTVCLGPVGRERLEILPQVATCMTCQRDARVG